MTKDQTDKLMKKARQLGMNLYTLNATKAHQHAFDCARYLMLPKKTSK